MRDRFYVEETRLQGDQSVLTCQKAAGEALVCKLFQPGDTWTDGKPFLSDPAYCESFLRKELHAHLQDYIAYLEGNLAPDQALKNLEVRCWRITDIYLGRIDVSAKYRVGGWHSDFGLGTKIKKIYKSFLAPNLSPRDAVFCVVIELFNDAMRIVEAAQQPPLSNSENPFWEIDAVIERLCCELTGTHYDYGDP